MSVPFKGNLSSRKRPKWIKRIAAGDEGLGSHSKSLLDKSPRLGQNLLALTLSPVPPDQFLQSVDADDKGIKDTTLILGRNVSLR